MSEIHDGVVDAALNAWFSGWSGWKATRPTMLRNQMRAALAALALANGK
jgi:hypothetical protein